MAQIFDTQEQAQDFVLGRIKQRFTERPELWEAYQALPEEERASVKQQIQQQAAAGIEVKTGQMRPIMGRTTAQVPVTRGFFDPQPDVPAVEPAVEDEPGMSLPGKVSRTGGAGASRMMWSIVRGGQELAAKGVSALTQAMPLGTATPRGVRGPKIDAGALAAPVSNFAKEMQDATSQAFGEDPEFRNSFAGQLVEGGVQLIGQVGTMGVGLVPQMYDEALKDAEQSYGKPLKDFTPEERQKAETVAGIYSVVGGALEYGPIKLVTKKLKGPTKDVIKKLAQPSFRKEVIKGFALEGATEATQGQILDELGKYILQDGRDTWNAEQLQMRFTEFMVGGILGGTMRGSMNLAGRAGQALAGDPGQPAPPIVPDGGMDQAAVAANNEQIRERNSMSRLLDMLDEGLRTVQEADPDFDPFAAARGVERVGPIENPNAGIEIAGEVDAGFDVFAAVRPGSSPAEQGATTAEAQPNAADSQPSPAARSSQSPDRSQTGGDAYTAQLREEAQGLSKSKLQSEALEARRRIKYLKEKLDKGHQDIDPVATQEEINQLFERQNVFDSIAKDTPAQRGKIQLASYSPKGNHDYISTALDMGPVPYDKENHANLLNDLDKRLRPFFKQGKVSDTLDADNDDPVVSQQIAEEGEYGQVERHRDALMEALAARDAEQAELARIEYMGKTDAAFLNNEGRGFGQQTGTPVRMADLQPGDKFEIKGEVFNFNGFTPDGKALIEDGRKFIVEPELQVYVDRGQVEATPYEQARKELSTPKKPLTKREYVQIVSGQGKSFDAKLLDEPGITLPKGYKVRGSRAEPINNLAKKNQKLSEKQARHEKRLIEQSEKQVLAEEVAEGRIPTNELPEDYFKQVYAEQMQEDAPVSNDTAPGEDYFMGDRIQLTGNIVEIEGREFEEFIYLEGAKESETGVRLTAAERQVETDRLQQERKDMQEGFKRVRESGESDQMPAAPGELIANDDFSLTNEDATDASAELEAERARREQDAAQGQMFDVADVRGSEGEAPRSNPSEIVREVVRSLVGRPLRNTATGIEATVSGKAAEKMASASSIKKSVSSEAHIQVAQQLEGLFEQADLLLSRPDARAQDQNIRQVHRFAAPIRVGDEILAAKITVKEYVQANQGIRIYNIEAVDMTKPAGLLTDTDLQGQASVPLTGFMNKVANLQAEVNRERQNPSTNADVSPDGTSGDDPNVRRVIDEARDQRPEGETDFQRFALNLHEMVMLAKALGKGEYPKIREVIRAAGGLARGVFKSVDGEKDSGSIELARSTYELLSPEEIAEIQDEATEAGYQAYLDELEASGKAGATPPTKETYLEKLKEDESLAAQLRSIEQDMLTERRQEVSREREPYQALSTLAHEIGHWIDFLPDGTLSRGNVLGRIAGFHKYFKRMLPASADAVEGVDPFTLSRKDRDRIRRIVRKETTDPAEQKELYDNLIQAEAKAQGLITLDAVRGELEALTSWWRLGGGELSDYHRKPEELYADAFSVLLNAPQELQARAPTFYAAFEAYIESKQDALAAYDQMQEAIKTGTARKDMRGRLRESLDKESAVSTQQQPKESLGERWDQLTRRFLREFQPFYRQAKKQGREKFEQSRAIVKDFLYRATHHEYYISRLERDIINPLKEAGVTMLDMDEYMTLRHIVDNRFDIYSTMGISAKEALPALNEMQAANPVQYAAMEAAQDAWFTLRKEMVIAPLRKSGVFNDELMDTIEQRYSYAPARANIARESQKGTIEELLQHHYGKDTGMRIARQLGNLGEIKSPMNQLMGVDLRLMDFVKRNAAKAEVVRVMQATDPANVRPADTRKVFVRGRYKEEPVHIENKRVGTLYVMRDGETSAYYLPKSVEEPFNTAANISDDWFNRSLYFVNSLQKSLFTQLNPGFWPIALGRDLFNRYRKMPSGERDRLRDFAPVGLSKDAANILGAFRDAWSTLGINMTPDAELAMRRQMPISRRETVGHGNTFAGADIDAQAAAFKKRRGDFYEKQNYAVKQILKAWDFWLSIGQAFERAPKIASMRYVDEHHPNWSEAKKRNFVRMHGGSPDFLERGTIGPVMDTIMLFHNPAREGWMSEKDAYDLDNKGYLLRGGQVILPTLAFKYAGLGLLGAAGYALVKSLMPWIEDEEEMIEMNRSISHYDQMNYINIPIRWADKENKKVMYFRIPLDEISRVVVGSMMQPALGAANPSAQLSYMGGQVPGMNPILQVALDWREFMMGRNPYDSFYQRNVIGDTEFKAGKGEMDMLRHSWNSLGGSIIKRAENNRPSIIKKTKEEEFLSLPLVQNTLGRWFKVSNAGQKQRLMKHPDVLEAGKGAARETLMAKSILESLINQRPLTRAQTEAFELVPGVNEKVQRYLYDTAKRAGPQLEALEALQTQEEKTAALEVMGD